ncbi:oligosaccharide flippase family protein [Quadrisphaera setariae]|uniref:Oligosaccharide flippase family protein n=1 Tax=Quadrisphaera setariae TaxID=2593304 RepID=A0A5C8ZHC9_9ACTN|nr:oligosaccharide flippase family protein [Quadrisphaera setariae]
MNLLQQIVFVSSVATLFCFGELSLLRAILSFSFATVITAAAAPSIARTGLRLSPRFAKQLARDGLRYTGSEIVEVANNRLDQVLMLPVIGAIQAGYYAVAVTLSSLLVGVGQSFAAGSFKQFMQDPFGTAEIRRTLSTATLVSLLGAAMLTCIAPFAIPLVFSSAYREATPVSLVSLIGAFTVVPSSVGAALMLARDRARALMLCQSTGLACGIGTLYVLGPPFGATGAAAASTLGYIAAAIAIFWSLRVPVRCWIPSPATFRSGISVFVYGR